jgi:electron transport complex protein RnfB
MTAVFIAVGALIALALVFGAILGFASVRFRVEGNPIAQQIDALLPQTQCGQCGYPGCKPYAEAVAGGDVHNKCVPGGTETVVKLSELLGREVLALDADEADLIPVKKVAYIREPEWCRAENAYRDCG